VTRAEVEAYLASEEYVEYVQSDPFRERCAELERRLEAGPLTMEEQAKIVGLPVDVFIFIKAFEMTQDVLQQKFEELFKQKFETWKQRRERTTVEHENLSTEQRATIEGLAHKLLLIEPQDRAPAMQLFVGEYNKSLRATFPGLSETKIESAVDRYGDLIFTRFCELDATAGGHA
jgi:hypothetical protein